MERPERQSFCFPFGFVGGWGRILLTFSSLCCVDFRLVCLSTLDDCVLLLLPWLWPDCGWFFRGIVVVLLVTRFWVLVLSTFLSRWSGRWCARRGWVPYGCCLILWAESLVRGRVVEIGQSVCLSVRGLVGMCLSVILH